MTREQLIRCDPELGRCLAAAFGEGKWRFTVGLSPQTRSHWRRRQATYLVARGLLLRNPEALADILERLMQT